MLHGNRLGVLGSVLCGSLAVAACTQVTPPVIAVPGPGKDFATFEKDDAFCRAAASQAAYPGSAAGGQTAHGSQAQWQRYFTGYTQCEGAHGNTVQTVPWSVFEGYGASPAYATGFDGGAGYGGYGGGFYGDDFYDGGFDEGFGLYDGFGYGYGYGLYGFGFGGRFGRGGFGRGGFGRGGFGGGFHGGGGRGGGHL